jgi:hypothetical protein
MLISSILNVMDEYWLRNAQYLYFYTLNKINVNDA